MAAGTVHEKPVNVPILRGDLPGNLAELWMRKAPEIACLVRERQDALLTQHPKDRFNRSSFTEVITAPGLTRTGGRQWEWRC